MKSLLAFYRSSIGRKWIVALTGLGLIGFLIGHLLGNLQIFWGPDKLNSYAEKLQHLGPLLWAVRIGLLVIFVLHIQCTIALVKANREARPEKYVYYKTVQASKASRTMMISGLIIFSFVMFHLLQFTLGWIDNKSYGLHEQFQDPRFGPGRHDVYRMVVAGFNHWPVSFFYLLGMGLLCVHLTHGVSSLFQTLGLRNNRVAELVRWGAFTFGVLIFLGYSSIPVAVMLGLVNDHTWPFGSQRQPAAVSLTTSSSSTAYEHRP